MRTITFEGQFNSLFSVIAVTVVVGSLGSTAAHAQFVVPGTGMKVQEVGDDFEDEKWAFNTNGLKASSNLDKDDRLPAGEATNGRWYESTYRGQPDSVQRVATPPGGISGSKGSMAIRTLYSGVPGNISFKQQQDDLLANVSHRLGGPIPVEMTPSVTTRVYLPPFEKWERRTGSSFGYRVELQATKYEPNKKMFRKGHRKTELYWPGFFIQLNARDAKRKDDSAILLIRADEMGQEIHGPLITQPGWWTLGMSFTADGKVHYFAHAGVADLTMKDHIASAWPYGFKAENFNTFFYNVVNQDDGRSWSTEWVVDDPALYMMRRY